MEKNTTKAVQNCNFFLIDFFFFFLEGRWFEIPSPFCSGHRQTVFLAQPGLVLVAILLPQPPKGWDYRHAVMAFLEVFVAGETQMPLGYRFSGFDG